MSIKIIQSDKQPCLKYKFFYGETVRHKGDERFYTICDLSNADQDYYGMHLLGTSRAIPSYYEHGVNLESISTQ